MVHEHTRSEIWYHDILNDFSIISDGHCIIKSNDYGWFDQIDEDNGLTEMESRIVTVEKQSRKLCGCFKELVILDRYNYESGKITIDEYESTRSWYDNIMWDLDEIEKKYRGLRVYKSVPVEEYDILYEYIGSVIRRVRELIRDRYMVECDRDKKGIYNGS